MLRRARVKLLRRVSGLDLRLGLRLTAAALLAMGAARLLGLPTFYWAGISAIVVATGSPGGSFSASLARVGGTLAGLAAGLLAVWMLGHSLLAAVLAIPVAILLCQAVGLRAAVKVAALSTLFPVSAVVEPHGLAATFATVGARAENVLLGCVVTLLLDGLLWPERSSAKLQARLRRDVARAGDLAARILEAYAGVGSAPGGATLAALQGDRMSYAALLQELGSEPEDPTAPRARLASQVEALHLLVDHCAALRDLAHQAEADQAMRLLGAELGTLAARLRVAARAFEGGVVRFAPALAELRAAASGLEAAYEAVRGERGTQAYPTREAFRLLGVLYLCGALVRALAALEEPGPEAAGVLEA